MIFSWLRRAVRNAILAGVNDAVDVLDIEGTPEDTEPGLQLRLKLVATPALPAGEETRKGGKKGVAS
jgi:hypothetical protein